MKFDLTILGCSGAKPALGRFPTSQILEVGSRAIMFDCGEGAQFQLERYKAPSGKIDQIFITHLHGDHFFGLIGLIQSYILNRRTRKLDIFGPAELEEILNIQLGYGKYEPPFEIRFHAHEFERGSYELYSNKTFSVQSIPLDHRIPTFGFIVKEKPPRRRLNAPLFTELGIDQTLIPNILNGKGWTSPSGDYYDHKDLTLESRPPRSFAFCTDTMYKPEIVCLIEGCDLLYHEATFLEEHKEKAIQTGHSTAREAAHIAQFANVKKLLIGHYSARYYDLEPLVDEARAIFDNTHLALQGEKHLVPFLRRDEL